MQIFQSLFADKGTFTDEEWSDLIVSHFDGATPDGEMMKMLSRLPGIMREGRELLQTPWAPRSSLARLRHEVHEMRVAFGPILVALRNRLETDTDTSIITGNIGGAPAVQFLPILRAHYARSYGTALSVAMILGAVLSALDESPALRVLLDQECEALTDEIIRLADTVAPYRPLGTIYMVLCLRVAWIGAFTEEKKQCVLDLLGVFNRDFFGPTAAIHREHLDFIEKRFRLHTMSEDFLSVLHSLKTED